jgi:hypothetical protein
MEFLILLTSSGQKKEKKTKENKQETKGITTSLDRLLIFTNAASGSCCNRADSPV